MRALWVSSIAAMILWVGCTREAEPHPGIAVVEQLYRVRIEGKMTGAPNADELAKMAPYLSTELKGLLAKAAQLRDEEARLHPDEKPPFVEGDLFGSLFEGPTSAKVSGTPPRLRVDFTDDRANPAVTWSDYAIVKQEGERWVVSDVEYAGQWDFANKGALVQSLKAELP